MGIVSTKLRNSAKGQPCSFQIPHVCNHNAETTVLCHAPSDVKGMGNKSDDFHAAFGCVACHVALDQHQLEKWEEYFFWLRGLQRTHAYWHSKGLMLVPVDTHRPTKSSKIMPRKHLGTGEIINV